MAPSHQRPRYKRIFRAEPVPGAIRGPNSGISRQSRVATDFIRAATVVAFCRPTRQPSTPVAARETHTGRRGARGVCDLPRIAASSAPPSADARRVCSSPRSRDPPRGSQSTLRRRHQAPGRAAARRAAGKIAHASRAWQSCGRLTSVCDDIRPHLDHRGRAWALFRCCAGVPRSRLSATSPATLRPRRPPAGRTEQPCAVRGIEPPAETGRPAATNPPVSRINQP